MHFPALQTAPVKERKKYRIGITPYYFERVTGFEP